VPVIPSLFTRLERYELKYHVSFDLLPALESFLRPWCVLDPACERYSDGFYPITSLYLDTPRHTFLKWEDSKPEGRFNLRVRAYGEQPQRTESWHFEIKDKRCDQVTKLRGVLLGRDPNALWSRTDDVLDKAAGEHRANLQTFLSRSLSYNANPLLLTGYRRRAWFGTMEDYARVTLDIGMRWREETGFDFRLDPVRMRPSDIPANFDPGCNAVLELKCARHQIPLWMVDLIRHFDLVRSGYSKFESAGREMLLPQIGGGRHARH
jgi:hypothetical protein